MQEVHTDTEEEYCASESSLQGNAAPASKNSDFDKWYRQRQPVKILPAFTGCRDRMQVLPHINISCMEKHVSDHIKQHMTPNKDCAPGGSVYQKAFEISQCSGARKCVYNYDDKYNFARIIPPDSLVFDSHFESANLYSAFRVYPAGPHQVQARERRQIYDLFMHNDINTIQHTQWFYFSVSNTRAGMETTFFLRNYSKPDSMFNDGMRPLIYSTKSKRGWERFGTEVCYFHSPPSELDITQQSEQPTGKGRHPAVFSVVSEKEDMTAVKGKKKKEKDNSVCKYTLSFTHIFEHSDDVCYFAFCHPYTYTDLQMYLKKLQEDTARSKYVRRSLLCKTLAGNRCELLSITAPARTLGQLKERVVIVMTARVHPGESNASWVLQGIIDFITGESLAARQLRSLYIFKIVPMLNPDGVINGNYRCSLSGQDLNRRWNMPLKSVHPTIFNTKNLIRKLKANWVVGLVLDIHGHSRKPGIFAYGCLPDRKLMKPVMSLSALAREYIYTHGSKPSGEAGAQVLSEQEQLLENLSRLADIKRPLIRAKSGSNMAREHGQGADSSIIKEKDISAVGSFGDGDSLSLDGLFPNRMCSMRDVLAWRVKLLPRIIGATASSFSLENCSFRMQKDKATTMRMVVFTELGVDCCYTVEVSMAGKNSLHFGVRDLLDIGSSICSSLLVASPSMLPTTSPNYHAVPTVAVPEAPITSDKAGDASSSALTLHHYITQFNDEMSIWKPLYRMERCTGSGASLLSDTGKQELCQFTWTADAMQEDQDSGPENDAVTETETITNADKEIDGADSNHKVSAGGKKVKIKKPKKSKKLPFSISIHSKESGVVNVQTVLPIAAPATSNEKGLAPISQMPKGKRIKTAISESEDAVEPVIQFNGMSLPKRIQESIHEVEQNLKPNKVKRDRSGGPGFPSCDDRESGARRAMVCSPSTAGNDSNMVQESSPTCSSDATAALSDSLDATKSRVATVGVPWSSVAGRGPAYLYSTDLGIVQQRHGLHSSQQASITQVASQPTELNTEASRPGSRAGTGRFALAGRMIGRVTLDAAPPVPFVPIVGQEALDALRDTRLVGIPALLSSPSSSTRHVRQGYQQPSPRLAGESRVGDIGVSHRPPSPIRSKPAISSGVIGERLHVEDGEALYGSLTARRPSVGVPVPGARESDRMQGKRQSEPQLFATGRKLLR